MTPGATYRLQLHEGFTFDDAADLVPYLATLGVTHLYLSPSLQSAPGSTHGYDVVDPTCLDDARGGEEGFARLHAAAQAGGLGLILDIVPNHLGLVPLANRWWWDVLQHGPDSAFAGHFDIDWGPDGTGRVVVPELGAQLADELERGDLRLVVEDGEARVAYHQHRWPVRPGTFDELGLPTAPADACQRVADDPSLLPAVLDAQHYRLVHWRRANSELNYRRFFDITTLGGVRIEDPEVFSGVHERVLRLVADGAIDGLRVDHPDGLWDPAGYADQLRAAIPGTWIVFEKILEAGEQRRAWPIDGTVGYEFATLLLHQFIDAGSEPALTDLYDQLLGAPQDYARIVDAAKREVLRELFPAELARLGRTLATAADELSVPVDRAALDAALRELLVDHPVYRTYVRPRVDAITPADARLIAETVARARVRLSGSDAALDLIEQLLTLQRRSPAGDEFVHRFQQLTGPLMAKGVEDTAFYRYLRFAAANEVGGDPSRLGATLGDLHAANQVRQRDWPTTLLSTSTHDTKRSEDVRARLAVCSEQPATWVAAFQRFRELARGHIGLRGPSPNHEYLTFQTLVGAWPISADRMVAYLRKAAREEKRETSWLDIDDAYESDLERYLRALLEDDDVTDHLAAVVERVRDAGWATSLAQALVKLTAPGVPDIYQGTELWDLSLVDPDNRRPVDHQLRAMLLSALPAQPDPAALTATLDDGRAKLMTTHRALHLRRQRPDAFGPHATYEPLYAQGERRDHVIAFVRAGQVIPVAPRRVMALGGAFDRWSWDDTTLDLPPGSWHDVLTGQVHAGARPTPMAVLLERFPVALLARGEQTP